MLSRARPNGRIKVFWQHAELHKILNAVQIKPIWQYQVASACKKSCKNIPGWNITHL